MTITGLILGPLLCLAILLPPGGVLVACFAATVFADGAIINLGGRTMAVGWFFALLVIGRVLFEIAIGRTGLRCDILYRLLPLVLFILSCFLSLIVALALFRGQVIVLPGSAGLQPQLAEPYRLMPENINQHVYLVLSLLFVYAIMHLMAPLKLPELLLWTNRAMRVSCGLATAVIIWHIASFNYGIWFPASFFHSDLHSGAWDQGVAGVQRPSGSFPEPSALTYYYASYLFYFWRRLRLTGAVADQIWLTMVVAVLVVSTSTTAYILIVAFAAYAVLDLGWGFKPFARGPTHRPRPSLRLSYLLGALCLTLTIWGTVQTLKANAELVDTMLQAQVLDKQSSFSYRIRSNADNMAKQIFLDTYGLGVGLGSHRPSSGLLALISGPGVLGTALFLLFLATAVLPPASASAAATSRPIRWAVIGLLLCHVITGPEFHKAILWLMVALALSVHLRAARTSNGSAVTSTSLYPPGSTRGYKDVAPAPMSPSRHHQRQQLPLGLPKPPPSPVSGTSP